MATVSMTNLIRFFIALDFIIALDQLTKWWATRQGWVTFNSGISGGFGAELPAIAMILLILSLLLGVLFIFRDKILVYPNMMALFIGGGISNIIDRLFFAGVRDWLVLPGVSFHNNLADCAVVMGAIGLSWYVIRQAGNKTL